MFVPANLAHLACLAASAGDQSTAAAVMAEAHAVLGGSRQAIVFAALRYAEGIMAWHQGEFASAERSTRKLSQKLQLTRLGIDMTELPRRVTARVPACRRIPCVAVGSASRAVSARSLPDLDRSAASPEP
jgi:hypothetical protein